MFFRWGRAVSRTRWLVLAGAIALAIAGIAWGSGVFSSLATGGFNDPSSPSATAEARITAELGNHSPDLLVLYSSRNETVQDATFRASVAATVSKLRANSAVAGVMTYYNSGSAALVSRDGHETYAVVRLSAPDSSGKESAYNGLRPELNAPGLTTQVGGTVALDAAADSITKTDIGQGEKIAFPAVLVLLILIFGGLAAAAMPLLIGGLAILGALTATRLITLATSVSTFAVNTIILLGLGMGIDYSLLVISRFREELAAGLEPREAIARTVATAGRTVAVSALTVALSLASLLIFPEVFLRSMAFGGMAAVLIAMVASLTVLPVMLVILGPRINALRVPMPWNRRTRASAASASSASASPGAPSHGAWAAIAHSVMRRPVMYIVAVLAIVTVLGLPFGGVHFAGADTRILPAGTEARVVSERVAADFPGGTTAPIQALVEGASAAELQTITSRIGTLPGVTGTAVTASRGTEDLVTVDYSGPANGDTAYNVVREIRALPLPTGTDVLVGGAPADDVDLMANLGSLLPAMIAISAAVTLLLLWLAFGSILLPVISVLMNTVSIIAAFGVLVWAFQDGHLAGPLNFTVTGTLQPNIIILILAILFGLATDYEVFLLSRIREVWDETGENTTAVAAGLQRTGRIITAAALLLMVVAAGFSTGQIVITKVIGIGMIVALIVDASLVRILLVPALMRLFGRLNWWAPGPLARMYRRYGTDSHPVPPAPAAGASSAKALAD